MSAIVEWWVAGVDLGFLPPLGEGGVCSAVGEATCPLGTNRLLVETT